MNAELWRRARDIFDSALEKPEPERTAFVREAAKDDTELLREVESLLSSYRDSTELLDRSPAAMIPRADIPAPGTGERVGPWRLLREVGEGGAGIVYAAARDDSSYQKLVALKLLRPDRDSREMVRRFKLERQVLASLDHPNIGRMLDAGTTESGRPYLVMEFVEGIPIDRWCDSRDLPIRERIALFLQVCEAVGHAHRNLIVHCDLKPANILVTAEGTPKLLDFGIAKLLRPELAPEGAITRSAFGRMMTPEFASPEQIRGEPVKTTVDIYSLGVLLYRLLTGKHPYEFPSGSVADIERTVCHVEPRRPSAANSKLAGDLDSILLKALRKEPHLRFSSVEQFAADLRAYLAGEPVQARGGTFAYRAGKFIRRNRVGVAAATLAVVSLTAGAAVSVYYAQAANRRFQQARELTNFVLFQFDDAIRQGQTNARRVLVSEGLEYLKRLSSEAGSDRMLARELAMAYLKMGDIQGNPFFANLGDIRGARQSYQTALDRAQRLGDPVTVARAQMKLADIEIMGGDRAAGLALYGLARRAIESGASLSANELVRIECIYKTGLTRGLLGDFKNALIEYELAARLAREALNRHPDSVDATRLLALALDGAGQTLANNGDTSNGIARLATASDLLEKTVARNPENDEVARQAAAVSLVLADVLQKSGRRDEAEDLFRRMLRTAEGRLSRDPANVRFQRDRWVTMARLAQLLESSPRHAAEAQALTREVISVLKPIVSQPEADGYELYYYAWLLVKTPFASIRNPQAALPVAQRAVERTKGQRPDVLDLLACAQAGVGDWAGAIQTQRRALAMLPPLDHGARPDDLRRELEANLASFERARRR
jgi:tetratricopeptide (TPR) repeat protein